MISLLVSDFRKISVSVPSIPVAVLALSYCLTLIKMVIFGHFPKYRAKGTAFNPVFIV